MEPNIKDKSLKICVGIIHTDPGVIISSEEERQWNRGGRQGGPLVASLML